MTTKKGFLEQSSNAQKEMESWSDTRKDSVRIQGTLQPKKIVTDSAAEVLKEKPDQKSGS